MNIKDSTVYIYTILGYVSYAAGLLGQLLFTGVTIQGINPTYFAVGLIFLMFGYVVTDGLGLKNASRVSVIGVLIGICVLGCIYYIQKTQN